MKKLLLAVLLTTVVACEREEGKVEKQENSKNKVTLFKNNEKAFSKTDSADSIRVKNISPAAAGLQDESEDVDPKDINPPRR
ncbi:hypothetical protein [Chryseobacterium sp. MEBOG07]|uniref:hypothetical protein n=1 Tax=Chryseobacterium sp. MEBOG07 TaxID=2879939 RepID=UPI001F274A48|nr:hypothetical protein [Chryseobacterium sp. MEBOG07]UKB81237.1 hypothetical protein LF886_09675 [Chryseobacterium sp. MEBOG07]